jgi:protein TonB
MKKHAKDKDFIKQPIYKGGLKAMQKFIADNLQYPKEAFRNGIEGSVGLSYSINHHGIVTEVKVISGLGFGCDEEAVRLVSLLKFDVSKTRGLKVLFHNTLHVHFHLNKPQPTSEINYVIIPKAKPKSKEIKPSTGNSYSYTIG